MHTLGPAGIGVSPDDEFNAPSPPGVKRLHAAPRHGLVRSWGLLLAAIALGLGIAVVSLDRPSPVAISDAAAATQPASGQLDETTVSAPLPPKTQESAAASSSGAVVHVVGAVANPGVMTLPVGSRVADAVTAAGGVLPGADLGTINLARRVNDGEQIVVGVVAPAAPPEAPTASAQMAAAPGGGGSSMINLNQASSEDLQQLPRVGPVTAEKIIAYREQHGPFSSVEQLLDVPGIGEGTLAGLRELVTV